MKASTIMESTVSLRDPRVVMASARLGAMHQTRISFVRSMVRKMAAENWQVSMGLWEMDNQGFGTAVYDLATPADHYQLVVFSDAISDEDRNDRVIAEKWDVTFALVRGRVSEEALDQLRRNVPLQEAGRNSSRVLVLARANKSVRVFEHLVSALAAGQQPDPAALAKVGYILRTTAVYGNGKFGIADFETLQNNPDFNLSFSAQMCAVYLLRQFSLDWVHFLARKQGEEHSATLAPALQRYLGVGNATGLGMAPYLIKHPCVVDQWLSQRESALAKACSNRLSEQSIVAVTRFLQKAQAHLSQVVTIDPGQKQLNEKSVQELPALISRIKDARDTHRSWGEVLAQAKTNSLETQEVLVACIMEVYPDDVDGFVVKMNTSEELSLEPGVSVSALKSTLERRYRWAIDTDFSQPDNQYWFWYRSQDKEEPRMGIRGQEPGEERELSLDIGRQVARLYGTVCKTDPALSVARFLLQHPELRAISRRVWGMSRRPMGDIQMNVLEKGTLPMHLLRCKLAMFGATKFDPRSDRWVRVTLFQGAPLLEELNPGYEEPSWLFPLLPDMESAGEGTDSAKGAAQ